MKKQNKNKTKNKHSDTYTKTKTKNVTKEEKRVKIQRKMGPLRERAQGHLSTWQLPIVLFLWGLAALRFLPLDSPKDPCYLITSHAFPELESFLQSRTLIRTVQSRYRYPHSEQPRTEKYWHWLASYSYIKVCPDSRPARFSEHELDSQSAQPHCFSGCKKLCHSLPTESQRKEEIVLNRQILWWAVYHQSLTLECECWEGGDSVIYLLLFPHSQKRAWCIIDALNCQMNGWIN